MTNLIKSNHARVRQQQRHITNDALELLFSYGVKKRQRRGCAVIYLSKKGKKIAIKKNPKFISNKVLLMSVIFHVVLFIFVSLIEIL